MAFFQTKNLWINPAGGAAVLMLDVPGNVNHLSEPVLREIDQALDVVADHKPFTSLVLCSTKDQSFCHGFDDATWQRLTKPEDAERICDLGQAVCRKLAGMPIPSVAWIAGACLGAGLELALACDRRVVIDHAGTVLGFTEVEFAAVPGWGGVSRMAFVAGIERTFQMLIGTRKIRPDEAIAIGLADDRHSSIAFQGHMLPDSLVKRDWSLRPRRGWRQKWIERFAWGRRLLFRKMRRLLEGKLPDGLQAPGEVVKILRAGAGHDLDAGLRQARDSFLSLARLPALANLLRLEDLRQKARSPLPERATPLKVGIVGASGKALALIQTALLKGCQIVFREPDEKALGLTIYGILQNLNIEVRRGLLPMKDIEALLARIHSTISWKGFTNVDLVIHTADGQRKTHETELREIAAEIPKDCPLATTSPWLTLEDIQALLPRPDRLMRVLFPTPIGKLPLVEMHHGPGVDPLAIERLRSFAVLLGKAPIRVRDQAGFFLDRLWYPVWNEILILIREGLTPVRLDQILFRFGMIYSPLEYLDLIGLNVAHAHAMTMKPIFGDRLPLDDAWEVILDHDWLGRRTGKGLYRYRKDRKSENQFLVNELQSISPRRIRFGSPAEEAEHVVERIVGLTINEAFRCLEEKIVETADTLDLALMLTGWAPHRGGPIRHAATMGLPHWVSVLQRLADDAGERFTPCPELLNRAAE